MILNNINISNRFNVHPENLSIMISKVILYLKLQFSCLKRDINNLFNWRILSNRNILITFPLSILQFTCMGRTKAEYSLYQTANIKNECCLSTVRPRTGNYRKCENMVSENLYDASSYTINHNIHINSQFSAFPVMEKPEVVLCKSENLVLYLVDFLM